MATTTTVCKHEKTERVEIDGLFGDREHVADVCVDCFAQLPVGYNCPECVWEEIRVLERTEPIARVRAMGCPDHGC